jgi:octaprenyl-diphosphate synthase
MLMADFGSITYAMDRASAYIAAAKHELERFDDSTARRALSVAADYMITRDR